MQVAIHLRDRDRTVMPKVSALESGAGFGLNATLTKPSQAAVKASKAAQASGSRSMLTKPSQVVVDDHGFVLGPAQGSITATPASTKSRTFRDA